MERHGTGRGTATTLGPPATTLGPPATTLGPPAATLGPPATKVESAPVPLDGRRWIALVIVAVAQMMTALDATIVNIALPSVQAALGFADADRQWVITAYTLAFAGLLLVGGRAADRFGRRRTFLFGLAGFAVASALAGAAPNLGVLVAGRALQGAFAAVLAPSALSLIAVLFQRPKDRATAFAVYGAVASSGAAVGLLLGGALTEYLQWRWCLYVNVGIAGAALVGGWRVLPRLPMRPEVKIRAGSAVLAIAGLAALVLGCARAAEVGWGAPSVVVPIAVSAVGIVAFLVLQGRSAEPLLPLRLLGHRDRAGAYLAIGVGVVGSFGVFLMLTYHLQAVLGYSPMRAGLAFLPLTAAVTVVGAAVAQRLVHRVRPRTLIGSGLLMSAAGLALLTQLQPTSGYATLILPAEILVGAGGAAIFTPAISVVTNGIDPRDAGVAAAVANTAMQIGASVGVAVLNTIAVTATSDYLRAHPSAAQHQVEAVVHGFATATAWAAGLLVCAAVVTFAAVRAPRPRHHPSR